MSGQRAVRGGAAALIVLLAAAPASGLRARVPPTRVPWTFRADFAHGLGGWMSFPLAQDVGFDPSLSTAEADGHVVLVRDVEPLGRRRMQAGVVRPLECVAGAGASVDVEYVLDPVGQVASFDLIVAAEDGRRYSAPLPNASGPQHVRVTGQQLGLPAIGTAIQAVALVARLERAPSLAAQRITIGRFEIAAERTPEVPILSPPLDRSEVGRAIVARETVGIAGTLRLQVGVPAARVELFDGAHRKAADATVTGGAASVPLGAHPAPGLWTATVTSGGAETSFRFLVLGAMPPHPRILVREQRLDELRRGPEYARLREQIRKQQRTLAASITYNADAGRNIAQLPAGADLHPAFTGELRAYFKLLDTYADAIAYGALEYALTGDEAALASARRALLTVARWETWTPPRFASHGLHTYYEVGVFGQKVALGYDLLAPRLAPEDRRLVARAFRRLLIEPTVEEYFRYNRMPIAASNWMANSLGGAIAAAVAIGGDDPDPADAGALTALTAAFDELLEGLFPGDGSEVEPAGYENFAMQGISWGMAALDGIGVHPRAAEKTWAGFWWPYYAMVHPGLVLDTGDFDGRLERLSGFAWGAERAGIPALRQFYGRSSTSLEPVRGAVQHTGRALEQASGPLDLTCCSAPPADAPVPPPSRVFDQRGSAVLRSGWDAGATVISLRAGPWFNHEHHDEGSFQVAAFGDLLVGEAGYAAYYDDPRYATYFTQAPGHNTVVIDDDPFSQADLAGPFWPALGDRPRIATHLLAGAFDYVAADLGAAYAGQLREYTREYVFVKPDLLVVRDRIRASAPHAMSWLLHPPVGASLSTEGVRAAIETPHARATILAVGAGKGWGVRSAPIPTTRFDDLERGVIRTPRVLFLDTPPDDRARFLVGIGIGQAGPPEPVLRGIDAPGAEGIVAGAQAAGAGVAFRTAEGPLTFQGFSTDGTVLAVHGASDGVLAIAAREITRRGTPLFRSTTPVDVAWQGSDGGADVDVHAAAAADITVAGARPSTVRVDGSPVGFTFRNGAVLIRGLPAGVHRVSIRD